MQRPRTERLLALLFSLTPVVAPAGEPATASTSMDTGTRWDARGPGLAPWQAVACVDMADDGGRIALGTLALPGDPNVFLLDDNGKLVSQFTAGMRGPEQVALADRPHLDSA